ncbi:MAG: hypothetical protein HUJ25_06465 [Crocinitomicaceae bacterium]|nr:hypothetical protein [Crocinitomicaceae bacterium]
MKSAAKILVLVGFVLLTSCKSGFILNENKSPAILPTNIHQSNCVKTIEGEGGTTLRLKSDVIPKAFENINLKPSGVKQKKLNRQHEPEEGKKTEALSTFECTDTIYLTDGRVIPISFLGQQNGKLEYKKCDDPLNRTWRKEKKKVNKVVLSSGKTMSFNTTPQGVYQDTRAKTAGFVAFFILGGIVQIIMISLAAILYF